MTKPSPVESFAKAPITSFEIVSGIRKGIVPDKPGMYFDFFREAIMTVDNELKEFRSMMAEKYEETSRQQYLEMIPPGGERELAYELGDRYVRLFSIAHRHLIHQNLLVPESEKEKYRGQSMPIALTPEEHRMWERGEL